MAGSIAARIICIVLGCFGLTATAWAQGLTTDEMKARYLAASGDEKITALSEYLLAARRTPTDETLTLSQKCITEANATNNVMAIAHCNYALGVYYYLTENNTEQQERYYTVAQKTYQEMGDDLGQARVLTGLASVAKERGNQAAAIALDLEGLEFAQASADFRTIMIARYNLALTYISIKDYDKALGIYKDIREEAIVAEDEMFTFLGTVGLAMTYSRQGQHENAVAFYELALNSPAAAAQPLQAMQYYADYASELMYAGKNKDAHKAFQSAFKIGEEEGLKETAAYRWINAAYGILNINDGRAEEGREILKKITAELAENPSHTRLNAEIYSGWATAEASTGAYDQAYAMLDESYGLIQTAYDQDRATAQTMAEKKFETAAKEREIAQLEAQSVLDQVRLSRQKLLILSAGIIAALLCIFAFFAHRNYRHQKKLTNELVARNTEIKQQSDKIVRSLNEKEILLKEINHRTHNNLQMIGSIIRMQGSQIGKNMTMGTDSILRDMQRRIEAMSVIQRKLFKAEDAPFVPAQEFVSELVEQMINSFGTGVHATVNVDHVNLDVSTTEPLGLIINEMISNAFEHGFGPNQRDDGLDRLTVELRRKDKTLVLTVSDNGAGLPENFSLENTKSLGASILHALTEQIEGTLSVKRLTPGAQWRLVFPASNVVEMTRMAPAAQTASLGSAAPVYS